MKYQFEIMRVYPFILSLLFPCIFCSLSGAGQETYVFTRGLLASTPLNYGREAFYSDPLAWQLYHHTLVTPVEGAYFGVDAKGQPSNWKAMQTDSSGTFRTRGFGGGGSYLYLTYTAERPGTALLHVQGDGSLFFNGVPHAGDPYAMGWLYLPVILKKGLNEFYIRVSGPVHASLVPSPKEAQLNIEDPTIPVIVAGAAGNDSLQGAVVVINSSAKPLKGYRLLSMAGGQKVSTLLPEIPAMCSRKVSFVFNASPVSEKGHFDCQLSLLDKEKVVDEKKLTVEAVHPGEQYSVTFTSAIDGSLQYYAVTPQAATGGQVEAGSGNHTLTSERGLPVSGGAALFLSVHGAGVEAIGQARAYRSKDWGTLVAATNRRPRGFNWEDWGRLDALEVLAQAVRKFNPDPQLIYLTGHSMGGHGTWFLGATYPDKWAAIGACSGYPTLKDYGSHDGVIPDSARSPIEQLLLRASDQSDVPKLVTNYKPMGVYILHGDSDKVVPVRYARQMRGLLAAFHADMSYHEVPGAEHWYGNQSVDWPPMFDFFKWHSRKPDSLVNQIDFKTASPGISDSYYWASIRQQEHPLAYSHMQLTRDLKSGLISGSTENIRLLRLALDDFKAHVPVVVQLDNGGTITYTTVTDKDTIFLMRTGEGWKTAERPTAWQKGPQRYGTFKDAFRNHMVFVYGTTGNTEENKWSVEKARYDAETWYYRGNGAVDIIADKEYSPAVYAGRSVILYGNASTNSAWKSLLSDCPIQVQRGRVVAGDKEWKSDSLGAYFVWPLKDAPEACVAVIGGSGLRGMEAADANQYFAGASGFPDFMIFDMSMLRSAGEGVRFAGFFDNDWKLTATESEVGDAQEAPAAAQSGDESTGGSYVPILPTDNPADIIRKAAHVVPSPRQLRWQELELTAFFHFGINTFTDREWGDGKEDISIFNPTQLDAHQWIRVAKEAGIKQVILTAKHHDGFCLWPSAYTDHTIKNTPYKGGHGDIVKEFADACREAGMGFGLYLSPWDRNSPLYGDSAKYNDLFIHWLTELLTNYGKVDEIWFDGANGEGPNGKKQVYAFEAWYHLIRRLQPQCVIAIMGPDVRWVGTETGQGRLTEWSVLPVNASQQESIAANSQKDMTFAPLGDMMTEDLGSRQQLMKASGLIWYPAETDVSIRPGWFYHDKEDAKVKTPAGLMDLYFSSVGRNSVLLLNIPPNRQGLISDADVRSLQGWRKDMDATFGVNLAAGASVQCANGLHPDALTDAHTATYWTTTGDDTTTTINFTFAGARTFDVLSLQEEISVGQRVEKFSVEAYDAGKWTTIAEGTTIGYKRLIQFPAVTDSRVRLHILSSRLNPTIAEFGLYKLQE